MKKSLFLILLATLILAGCSSQKLSQDQLFEKKQECANYRSDMENQLLGFSFDYTRCLQVNEIFYSPTKNSCLYTIKLKSSCLTGITTDEEKSLFAIIDYFANDTIIYTSDDILNPNKTKKSDCYNKYLTGDFDTESGEEAVKDMKMYQDCTKESYIKTLQELKRE